MAPNWRLLLAVFFLMLAAGFMATGTDSDTTCLKNFMDTNKNCFHLIMDLENQVNGSLLNCKLIYQAADYLAKYMCLNWQCQTESAISAIDGFKKCFQNGSFASGGKCASDGDISALGCGNLQSFRTSLRNCKDVVAKSMNLTACDAKGKAKAGMADQCMQYSAHADCMLEPYCQCDGTVQDVAVKAAKDKVDWNYAYYCQSLTPTYTASCSGNGANRGNGNNTRAVKVTPSSSGSTLKWALIGLGVLALLAVLGGIAWWALAGRRAAKKKGGKRSLSRKSSLRKGSSNRGSPHRGSSSRLRGNGASAAGSRLVPSPSKAGKAQSKARAPSKLRRNTSAGPLLSKAKASRKSKMATPK